MQAALAHDCHLVFLVSVCLGRWSVNLSVSARTLPKLDEPCERRWNPRQLRRLHASHFLIGRLLRRRHREGLFRACEAPWLTAMESAALTFPNLGPSGRNLCCRERHIQRASRSSVTRLSLRRHAESAALRSRGSYCRSTTTARGACHR